MVNTSPGRVTNEGGAVFPLFKDVGTQVSNDCNRYVVLTVVFFFTSTMTHMESAHPARGSE